MFSVIGSQREKQAERDDVMSDTLTTYYQVVSVIESTSTPLTAAAAAAAADCHVHLCHPARRIFDINCPSAVFTNRDGSTAVGRPDGRWK